MDGSTADNDYLNFTLTDSFNVPAGVTISNVETISLDVAAANKIFSLGGTISGLKNIVASGKGITINAAAYDKNGLNISGGAGNDVLIGTKNADVFNGGLGADKFVADSQYLNIDTIADFSGKNGQKDTILLTNWSSATNKIKEYDGNKTTVTEILNDLSSSSTTVMPAQPARFTVKLDNTVALTSTQKFAIDGTTVITATGAMTTLDILNTLLNKEFAATNSTSNVNNWKVVAIDKEANTFTVESIGAVLSPFGSSESITVTANSASTNITVTKDNPGTSAPTEVVKTYFESVNDLVYFEIGGDTYVAQGSVDATPNDPATNSGKYDAANSVVVKLTGTALGLDAADFVTA